MTPKMTVAEILDRAERHFLAATIWDAENARAVGALTVKLLRSEQMGATPQECLEYAAHRLALLPSLDDLETEAVSYGPIELAEAELRIARGLYVDADDAALQAILAYKAERDRRGVMVQDRRDRAVLYVKKRSAARAKVHAARAALDEIKIQHTFRQEQAA